MVNIPALNHGLIGNGSLLALVSPTSAMEWLCLPSFDGPAVFARLLDDRAGGVFRILSGGRELQGEQAYLPNTNVLRTRFQDGEGRWEILDFAPRLPKAWGVEAPIRLHRVLRPLSGRVRLSIDFDPRLDYGQGPTRSLVLHDRVEVQGPGGPLHLQTNLPLSYVMGRREFTLEGPVYLSLSYGSVPPMTLDRVQRELESTRDGWVHWAKTCGLPLFKPELVLRSALCLKLHAFEDTGAIIAATTTSIPEAMGSERTWDYRYCWLRDAAFVVEALRRLGHMREGERFLRYLQTVAEAGPLQPLYGIDGSLSAPERLLGHLAGFGGQGPVRIGNAAVAQRQHDLMGELMLCLETLLRDPRLAHDEESHGFFPLVRRLVEEAIALAPLPDTSIWEYRTQEDHYTFSRAMCWVAIQRGAAIARRFGEHALAGGWQAVADRERSVILEQGYNTRLGFFTQTLGGLFPDASLLLLPTLGLIDPRDPRFLSTLDRYGNLLTDNGLMLRYRHADDLGAPTSAFTICSFWWAEALALAGRLEEAVSVFERVCAFANPVGLFSEDIDPATGRLLGNFPQAYTHVGLINAAITLSELLEARDGQVRAWSSPGAPAWVAEAVS
ncbi:glycoside hydrolase family 15 protein [Mesoterricola silvestris]|uniref:Glucoamylase n=1 Tax=Mesoterricola silvestris TaxID=2927979 RepID=A0AA48GQL6_9BACT|nr:glycoside hydrolase family 15 protein [Mesoterricola silvestris]BDU74309.1 glucoamylase [Mesoterricola silvestris]